MKILSPMNSSGKLQYLNSIELAENAEAEMDYSRKKHFATFPYPYMNGKLHLGHLYSLSKADFYTYFKKLEGYNVLFPFAFHCTGMPISASAYKLQQELDGKEVDVSIVKILKELEIEDATPFTDPIHWIRTFPKFCISSLKKFHAAIDWRRSFITTDINKYYDSFVQYQFNKLKRLGYLNFGKRYSIYCTIDQQACLDHDRRRGEGLKPIEVILRKIPIQEGVLLLIRAKNSQKIDKVVISKTKKFCCFIHKEVKYILEEELFENLRYQTENMKCESIITGKDIRCNDQSVLIEHIDKYINSKIVNKPQEMHNTVAYDNDYKNILDLKNEELKLAESKNFIKMYEPEGEIISRSGSKCVVSLLDQWYIDYGNEEWKQKARECVKQLILHEDTRAKLEEAIEWINKWGFSRSFGLGTKIPWDKQYLIDSLSDSTIYNAFYTFKHLLFSDLEGQEEIFPSKFLCNEVFEYIFDDISEIPSKLYDFKEILVRCKESFEYFYPVDIRVSGKDLIGNHLTFFIFNHVALFKKKYWPKRMFTNGHLMLNSKKMSKSEGNFLTVENALKKFGASATRMCLADCGDTNEDANFLESTANSMVLKLYTLAKDIEELKTEDLKNLTEQFNNLSVDNKNCTNYVDFIDEMFLQAFSRNIQLALESHENMIYRDVLKYGFYENIRVIETYYILKGNNNKVLGYGYKSILQLLYPIIPSFSNYFLKTKFKNEIAIPKIFREGTDKIEAIDYIKAICSRINSIKRNSKSVKIGVNKNYSEWKQECMRMVDASNDKLEIVHSVAEIIEKYKLNKGKTMIFCMDYFNYRERYLLKFDEYEVLNMFRNFIEASCDLDVEIMLSDSSDPLIPDLKFY